MARHFRTRDAGHLEDSHHWQSPGWGGFASPTEGKTGQHDATTTHAPTEDPDSGGMAVIFGGQATAVGSATLAQGDLSGRVVDNAWGTKAYGTATFTATALVDEGGTGLASTDTFYDVTGADFVFAFRTVSPSETEVDGQTLLSETSTLRFLAIDIANWDPPKGPVVVETTWALPQWSSAGWGGWHAPDKPDGHIAEIYGHADATGDNTLTDVGVSALTGNQYSNVFGIVAAGVA